MPTVFSQLAVLCEADAETDKILLEQASRVAPLLLDLASFESLANTASALLSSSEVWLDLSSQPDVSTLASKQLDGGISRVVVAPATTEDAQQLLQAGLPTERLVLRLSPESSISLPSILERTSLTALLVDMPVAQDGQIDSAVLASFREALGGKASRETISLFIRPTFTTQETLGVDARDAIRSSFVAGTPVLDLRSRDGLEQITSAFLSALKTDRPDALYSTVVASSTASRLPLGLVYSSAESIKASIETGRATYFSRSRNEIWKKGETSGATQVVERILIDCDGDALLFSVVQKQGTSFCHTEKSVSCFAPLQGLADLEQTLLQRKANSPAGSYSKRLFDDSALLEAKIREEADEVCRATTKEETAAEVADLIYFALARCVSKGVTLADVEAVLDKRALKLTRRPGNAKPAFTNGANGDKQEEAVANLANRSTVLPIAQLNGTHPEASQPNGRIVPPIYTLADCSAKERQALLKRPLVDSKDMVAKVQPILDTVRTGGDVGLRSFIEKFDRCPLAASSQWSHTLTAPFPDELARIDPKTKAAIDVAFENIKLFHARQMDKESVVLKVETMPGIVCSRFARPIDRVGLYVPGGTAVLPSTAMMLAIPAHIAQCPFISIATPPSSEGKVRPEIVYIAQKCGVHQIVMAGGAQAVAAMAYGTETVGKVDKIFGPGNQWVNAAKMAVSMSMGDAVSIDAPAGPSEVLVIADRTADAAFVASDLLSQAEHGPDSQVVCLAINLTDDHLTAIQDEINKQASVLPRVGIVKQAISKSLTVRCAHLKEALAFSNDYAPEHLILHLEDAPGALDHVRNAGSVFVGAYSPESCGDYASGTNHTLPTAGYARQYSGVSTSAFLKHITSQQLTAEGLDKLGPSVVTLAEVEGLEAHANAVRVRLQRRGAE
ncbi:uncharacterized protein L969DRAFT_76313 [Mixia osmundae IAM 14324]|uniref:Histidine biosynthesis trifunctional protein n=1 Tax=Mixia osmundae (strain CBS 9802 / IAM 14324 / JCM 22182 / KY 12970) TaxID=764103 RepID=G7DZ80_MIXOS|nr:uncharacterized protein L969DRAFT_76313 [Mixia osmundae IAM 14324]KEI38292.1 hypothetical protein L969DRAFT_76313 [Mixia osmundae IAM 14324]GAA95890.1 hypothetical protein E5Q_02548 [Mixia osmundae IAM 14324]